MFAAVVRLKLGFEFSNLGLGGLPHFLLTCVVSINLYCEHKNFLLNVNIVVLLHCGCLSLNPFIEFRIRNNSSSSDVLYIHASISISPKYESN